MNPRPIEFPLVVCIVAASTTSPSLVWLVGLKAVLKDLRGRSPSGVLVTQSGSSGLTEQIAETAKQAGIQFRNIETPSPIERSPSAAEGLMLTDIELVDMSDVLVLIRTRSHDEEATESELLSYSRNINRVIIEIDAKTGKIDRDLPGEIEKQQGWLPDLFAVAGLSADADLETIKSKMSAIANRAAPLTRRRWRWLLLLQGFAVLIPLAWLVQPVFAWRIEWIGAATLGSILLLMAIIWWLRWRGMQRHGRVLVLSRS